MQPVRRRLAEAYIISTVSALSTNYTMILHIPYFSTQLYCVCAKVCSNV